MEIMDADSRLPTMHGYGYARLSRQQYQHAWSGEIGRRGVMVEEELATRQRLEAQRQASQLSGDGTLRSELSGPQGSSRSTTEASTVSSFMTGLSEGVSRIERLELKLERERRKRRELELALQRAQQPEFLRLFGNGEKGPWGHEPH